MANKELVYQHNCVIWMQNKRPDLRGKFRRVKNETDNHGHTVLSRMIQGNENKATGIVAGVWDMFFIHEPILWIEFKIRPNGLSVPQKEFKRLGIECGWYFAVAEDTLENFQKIVNQYF